MKRVFTNKFQRLLEYDRQGHRGHQGWRFGDGLRLRLWFQRNR